MWGVNDRVGVRWLRREGRCIFSKKERKEGKGFEERKSVVIKLPDAYFQIATLF